MLASEDTGYMVYLGQMWRQAGPPRGGPSGPRTGGLTVVLGHTGQTGQSAFTHKKRDWQAKANSHNPHTDGCETD